MRIQVVIPSVTIGDRVPYLPIGADAPLQTIGNLSHTNPGRAPALDLVAFVVGACSSCATPLAVKKYRLSRLILFLLGCCTSLFYPPARVNIRFNLSTGFNSPLLGAALKNSDRRAL